MTAHCYTKSLSAARVPRVDVPVLPCLGEGMEEEVVPVGQEAFIRLMRENRRLHAMLEAECRRTAALRVRLDRHRDAALTDPLTGLHNRRAMDQCLGRIWGQAQGRPLAIVVLDIDYFKRINDTYGHANGDNVLAWVAATLRRCIRVEDRAFRYGGEEFLVLLADTSLEGAVGMAEAIRGRIESMGLACTGGTPVPLTVSLGVAARRAQDDPASLFERADRALYQAKHGGRNRVVHENLLA